MSEITSPNITFMLQYTEANAQYVDYTNRDEAVELENDLSLESHHVNVTEESELAKAVGTHPYVNSNHHQAIKTIANNFNIVATAPDGIIEAIESTDQTMLGIQWRPDKLLDDPKQEKIFTNFFDKLQ